MLIASKKLKMPFSTLGNILDIGDYYALGSQLLRKDLTPIPPNRAFMYPSMSGGLDISYVWGRETTNQPPLGLSGSVAQMYTYHSAAGNDYHTVSPSAGSLFENLPVFLDSTLGTTNGKRLVFYLAASSSLNMSCGAVNSLGEVTWLNSIPNPIAYNDTSCKTFILGESANYVYVLALKMAASPAVAAVAGMQMILQYNKASGAVVNMSAALNAAGSIAGYFVRYLCKTDDNKIWFGLSTTCSTGLAANAPAYYGVLNLGADTFNYSTGFKMAATLATNNNGIFNPSQATICANDDTKYKAYWPIDPDGNTNGNMTIKLAYIPKAGMTTANGFTAPAQVSCTLTGGNLPVAYNAASGYSQACEVDMWLFNDNGNEYLAILYHAVLDPTDAQFGNSRIDLAAQAIYVYKIDPTDPTKLTFKSVVRDNGFGTNLIYGPFVKSVDGKTVTMLNRNGFVVLGFNSTTESFVYGPLTLIPVWRAALDQQGLLWIEDVSRNVYIFNPVNSNNIVVTFDTQSLTYTGSPLTANAIINSYDFYGNRQVASVNLNIQGGVFTSTGNNSVSVTTSATADTIVQLTITDAGSVVVTPVI